MILSYIFVFVVFLLPIIFSQVDYLLDHLPVGCYLVHKDTCPLDFYFSAMSSLFLLPALSKEIFNFMQSKLEIVGLFDRKIRGYKQIIQVSAPDPMLVLPQGLVGDAYGLVCCCTSWYQIKSIL